MKKLIIILAISILTFACKKKSTIPNNPFPPCEKTSENMSGKWIYNHDTIISTYQSVDCDMKGNNNNYYLVTNISKTLKDAFQDSTSFINLNSIQIISDESNYTLIYPNSQTNINNIRIKKNGGAWILELYTPSKGYQDVNILKI